MGSLVADEEASITKNASGGSYGSVRREEKHHMSHVRLGTCHHADRDSLPLDSGTSYRIGQLCLPRRSASSVNKHPILGASEARCAVRLRRGSRLSIVTSAKKQHLAYR